MKLKHLLLSSLLFLPTSISADEPKPNIINHQDTVQLSRQHKQSRSATVKIITPHGHGSGTYVKIGGNIFGGGSFGILTAAHVVPSGELFVVESGAQQTAARLLWKDKDADIAFLAVGEIKGKKPLKVVADQGIDTGDEIVYSGYPSTHELLTFSCNVASPNQNGKLMVQGYAWFGSSGSGFVNKKGEVFAVLSAVSVESFYGHPQVLETLVIGAIVEDKHISEIKEALDKISE